MGGGRPPLDPPLTKTAETKITKHGTGILRSPNTNEYYVKSRGHGVKNAKKVIEWRA